MKIILTFQRAQSRSAPDVWSFFFETPPGTTWVAGQSIKIELPTLFGPQDHRFTIADTPTLGYVVITTRLSDSLFKRALSRLNPGQNVRAFDISGDFVWQDSPKPLLFIAAGIGITPFYAMLRDRERRSLPLSAALIYINSRSLYRHELSWMQHEHSEFSVRFAEHRLPAVELAQEPDFARREVYVSGPSSMVDELSADLLAQGLPAQQLHRDWFTGNLGKD